MLSINNNDIILSQTADNKQDAIKSIANSLRDKGYVESSYVNGMLARELQNSTFLGNGIAIPHGSKESSDQIKQTGVILHHFPQGVNWGDHNSVYLAIGIAAKSDQHLHILKMLTKVLSAEGVEEKLRDATDAETIVDLITGKVQTEMLLTADLIELDAPTKDLNALAAAAATLLKAQHAISDAFVTTTLASQPTYLGEGLWLSANNQGINRTALSFVSTSRAANNQDKPVKGLLCLASNSTLHLKTLDRLVELIAKQKLAAFFSSNQQQIINLLTKEQVEGSQQIFTIKNPHGLHARPGALLVHTAKKFAATIQIARIDTPDNTVNAKSLMKIMTLGIKLNDQLQFTAQGEDAEQALTTIGQAIEEGLGEAIR